MRGDGCLRALALFGVIVSSLAATTTASAFCRTTTCGLPPGFMPAAGACYPPDFAARCASLNPPAKVLPVFWANACVSYDIQENASRQVPYATASSLFAAAFAKWTSTTCGAAEGSRVSIDVKDLGPVECDKVQYNSNQGNQHVILFHDDAWPYDDASNALGLTTITFDPDTGELYDADMEINSTAAVPLSLGDPVPPDGYDFQSIIQHETGHFLGMAHSSDPNATMFAQYEPGTTTMRTLSDDDVGGICSIYLPNGDRSVDPSVAASGIITEAACDPTPRHGFQSACAGPTSSKCSLSGTAGLEKGTSPVSATFGAIGLALAAAVRRRRSARATARRMW